MVLLRGATEEGIQRADAFGERFEGLAVNGDEFAGFGGLSIETPDAVAEQSALAEVLAGAGSFDELALGVGDVHVAFFDGVEGLRRFAGMEERVPGLKMHLAER